MTAINITPAELATVIAATDEYYIGDRTIVIDSADWRANDGSFILEGYVEGDREGDKHYIEAVVRVEGVLVDQYPYETASDEEEDID